MSDESYDVNAYSVRATTGILPAALAAGATVFSMRNTGTKVAYVDRIVASFGCIVSFTTGSQQLFVAERFTVATPTGGQQYTPMKHSTGSLAPSVTDCRAATTAALTTTGVTFDGNQIPIGGAASPVGNQNTNVVYIDYNNDPIRLLTGEGLCIRNSIVWPAAGTGFLNALVSWAER